MIKAIETRYAGRRFRSRREARWAILFDHLDLDWRYEPEGYCLPGNISYLPDFEIHYVDLEEQKRRCWIEVKPELEPYGPLSALCAGSEQWGWLVAEPMLRADVLKCNRTGEWSHPRGVGDFLQWITASGDSIEDQMRLQAASNAALSARWEHGESPRRKAKPGGRGPRAYQRPERMLDNSSGVGSGFAAF